MQKNRILLYVFIFAIILLGAIVVSYAYYLVSVDKNDDSLTVNTTQVANILMTSIESTETLMLPGWVGYQAIDVTASSSGKAIYDLSLNITGGSNILGDVQIIIYRIVNTDTALTASNISYTAPHETYKTTVVPVQHYMSGGAVTFPTNLVTVQSTAYLNTLGTNKLISIEGGKEIEYGKHDKYFIKLTYQNKASAQVQGETFTITPVLTPREDMNTMGKKNMTTSEAQALFTYTVSGNNITALKKKSGVTYTGRLIIPETIDGKNVTSLGSSAFSSCDKISEVILPSTLTSIGSSAFSTCRGLNTITIPKSVTSISTNPFSNCNGLYAFNVESDNTKFSSENGVLFDKAKTKIIAYPDGKSDSSYTVPSSVTTINQSAFIYANNLNTIEIPSQVTTINANAFESASYLTAINVNSNNANYSSENGVLYNKNKTQIVRFPMGKSGSFTVPATVTTLSDYAFRDCSKISSFAVASGNTSFSTASSVLFNSNKTQLVAYPPAKTSTTYTVPSTVTQIANRAFARSSKLKTINIPNTVESIGNYAFYYCSALTTINIPTSLTAIENYTFSYCSKLTSITIPNNITTIGSNAFNKCSALTSININKAADSISGSPWGAPKGASIVSWQG